MLIGCLYPLRLSYPGMIVLYSVVQKNVPLFEIPASILPSKMASRCTANWPWRNFRHPIWLPLFCSTLYILASGWAMTFWREKRLWPLSPSWGKLQASGTVQRIGLCTQQEFSRCWYWIDGQINCLKCIEKIHTLSTPIRPIFNIIPMQNFIHTYSTHFHQFLKNSCKFSSFHLPQNSDFLHFSTAKLSFLHFINFILFAKCS